MKWTGLVCLGVVALSPMAGFAQPYETADDVGEIVKDPGGQSVTLVISGRDGDKDSVSFRCSLSDQSITVVFGFGRSDSDGDDVVAPVGYLTINQNRERITLTKGDAPNSVILPARQSAKLFDSAKLGRPFRLERYDGAVQEYQLDAFAPAFADLDTQCKDPAK